MLKHKWPATLFSKKVRSLQLPYTWVVSINLSIYVPKYSVLAYWSPGIGLFWTAGIGHEMVVGIDVKPLDVDLNEKNTLQLFDSVFKLFEVVEKTKDMISRFSSGVTSRLKCQAI